MILRNVLGRTGRTIAITAAIVGGLGLAAAPQPAHAISTGEAVGIGVGAAVVGAAIGSSAAPAPGYYPQPVYAAPPPVYAQPAPVYGQPAYAPAPGGSCLASDGRYYPC